MALWKLVVLLCALPSLVAEKCEREENRDGCMVEDGHAHCEAWNITASIEGLPPCTTRITFSLLAQPNLVGKEKYTVLCLDNAADFSRLSHLEELTLRTNRRNFTHIRLTGDNDTCYQTLTGLPLRALRFQMLTAYFDDRGDNAGMYSQFKLLDTLEFTRGKKSGLSAFMHVLGPELSMKKLVLRNIQQYKSPRYTSTLDLAYFACGGNVEQLDLSYNDILAITVSTNCWNSKLQYLNLDHNLLAKTIPVQYFWMHAFPMFAGLQVLRASSSGSRYHSGLWDEPPEISLIDVNEDDKASSSHLSALSFLEKTPVGFLAGFDFWLKDLFKTCQHITYLMLVQCAVSNYDDNYAFFLCLDPNIYSYNCSHGNIYKTLVCLLLHNCNYTCLENIPIPLPPKLRSVSLHNFGKFADSYYFESIPSSCKDMNIHIHPHNNLQLWDMPSSNMLFIPKTINTTDWTVSGLHKMKYLNLQDHNLPFLLSAMGKSDMGDLEELHIGGERVSELDKLPRHPLEGFTKLSVLNLSYSSIQEFEADVFLKHTRLSVLDLSHNQLTASSLSSLDLSHTRLVSLNLSHNQLTSIPSSMRHQLERMEGLELYLSENIFICNCENLPFLEWIQSDLPITLHYSGDHACKDSPDNTIHNIEVDALHCDRHWKQPLKIVFSTLASVLLIFLSVSAYKKRFHISNLVFRIQERFHSESGEDLNTSFRFDAYVIYSDANEDRLWVHFVLRPKLEDQYGFRLCLEHRNFPVGGHYVDHIEKAIRSSRKVMLVMSRNFIESRWCVEGCQLTDNVDPNKFVVVRYKEVLFSGVHIPPVVNKVLLVNSNPITWNETPQEAEQLFWKRLRRDLYRKQRLPDDAHDGIILLDEFELPS